MFAIRNKRTKEWVYGTDSRYSPNRQRTSNEQALTYEFKSRADIDFLARRCGKDYEIVEVTLNIKVVEGVLVDERQKM